ncbi:hypothetical protein BOX15_Mlig000214g4 [Macrostomum lignano]|uniref:Ion transport domain-containing protein n=1 Tax=Macrostomum lignano TaxID=282301 RepID=A0A267DMF1_9PLAT|nr:hypothetical protein BOX15_Mlig000214g4 [Macrostomum lignano]
MSSGNNRVSPAMAAVNQALVPDNDNELVASARPQPGRAIPNAPEYGSPEHLRRVPEPLKQQQQQQQVTLSENLPVQMVRFLRSTEDGGADDQGVGVNIGKSRVNQVVTFQEMIEAAKEGRTKDLDELMGPSVPTGPTGVIKVRKNIPIDKRDSEGYSMLHYAARNNHSDVCELLIKRGADVNVEGPDQMTPLHLAAKYRRSRSKAAITKLKQSGSADAVTAAADIGTAGKGGAFTNLPPIHNVSLRGRARTARTRQAEASTNAKLKNEDESESLALKPQDERDAVYILLRHGADFTQKDFYGCTPLHYAAMKGNLVASRCLLHFESMRQKGRVISADRVECVYSTRVPIWRITDNEDMTALHLACAHSEVLIVKMLLEMETNDKDYLDMVENSGCTALHLASAEGNEEICSYLLHSAELEGEGFLKRYINRKDMENNTCLHSAVQNECIDVAEVLLKKGAFVNACNTGHETPLHLAARTGSTAMVELLIRHGASLNALDTDRQTALHKAANFNQNDLLKYLLEIDSSVIDAKDREENTPLLLASCQQDDPGCVQILLEKGANPLCTDGQDRSALYLAAQWHNTKVLKALLDNPVVTENRVIDEADVNNNTPLHVACENGYLDVVELLLRYKAKYDDKNEDEETPIHLAAKAGHVPIVRHLLRLSRNLAHDEDEDSNTPLHLAALAGHSKICQVLIEEGKADVEARNSRGWTAMDCAASKGFTKVAQVLLENDSPIDPADKSNVTPLFLACQGGHQEMVELLLKIGARVDNRIKYSNINSPLHNCNCLDAAIDHGHKKVALTLINSNQWKEALRNETIGEKGEKDTPLRKLIRKMPAVAEKVFNRCVENNKQRRPPDDPNYKVVFYYEFLDDMYSTWAPLRSKDAAALGFDQMEGGSNGGGSVGSGGGGGSDSASTVGDALSQNIDIYDTEGYLRKDLKFRSVKGSLKKNHPLMLMVKKKRETLLKHPLVSALLRHKWTSYGRWVYYINLSLYAIFLAAFTAYMLVLKPTYMYYGPFYSAYNVSPWSGNECDQVLKAMSSCSKPAVAFVAMWLVIGLGGLFLLKEVSQVFISRLKYINMENLMDWSIFSLAIVTVIDLSDCQRTCGVRTDWQWNTGALGILIAWLNLVLYIRKMPRFGIYVVMFTDIFFTFSRFFLVFFLFILSFSIAFYLLMQNQIGFDNLGKTILKTTVMMIGEFEYADTFDNQYEPDNKLNASQQIFYNAATYAVFVFFLAIMSIIIMNLLVGLAVDDIKAVQEQASLNRMAMQVELALDVEAILPMVLTRKFVIKSEIYYPNPDRSKKTYFISKMFDNIWITRDQLNRALDPELDQWDKIYKKQEDTDVSMVTVKTKLKELKSKTVKIEAMLGAIMRKLQIDQDESSLNYVDAEDNCTDEHVPDVGDEIAT